MSINIRSLKNYKKISKEFKKVLKQQLKEKPKSVIGIESTNNFLKVTNNLKKIIKLNWYYTHIFPLATYLENQKVPLDKELNESFIKRIYMPPTNYQNMHQLALRFFLEKKPNDLFLFDNLGGIDLLIFFIDFRGNFVFNDYESKKTFLNKTNNGSDLVSIGIKSILTAKKIICFCIDEASKDVVFKLNRRLIDTEDTLTYLHLHNDVTLFTLNSIISKNEINYDPMTQDKIKFLNELDNTDDNVDISLIEKQNYENEDDADEDKIHTNIENIDLDSANVNMDNLDESLINELEKEKEDDLDLENEINGKNEESNFDDKEDTESEEINLDFDDKEDEDTDDEKIDLEFLTDNLDKKEEQEESLLNEVEDEIEHTIFDIGESTDELENQVYETELNIENVDNVINQIESDVSKLEKEENNNKEKNIDTVEYHSEFLYSDPSNFDFSTWTWVNDERNKGYISKRFGDFKPKKEISDNKETEVIQNVEKNKNTVALDDNKESIKLFEKEKKININDNLPDDPEKIYKYLMIKNETLGQVEKLLLSNRLGKIEYELILEILEQNLDSSEKRILRNEISKLVKTNKNIASKKNYVSYKLSYVSGFRPTPLLMVWYDVNKKFYDDLTKEMEENFSIKFSNCAFDKQISHVWNDGCYVTYNPDSLSIRALAFNSVEKLIYLLRHINKNLTMRIADEQTFNNLSNLLVGWESELKVEKI